ncbi:Hypothetical Protein FCC1311_078892 [Hondaea fermentalgiana]|uniref:Uncharacterized protein n=1 Tax=Hondaea fermentalgiana TaxID=2315210 RepID=A0A2R5GUS6_9STRA|nr:Hypothetical Protein FCC1311_078892 [Hondaea fermentalgiana]|eukprot:GBG31664.1 Hypothetical Protein FCC1311_078892 [Hondaea fermentalgiana]
MRKATEDLMDMLEEYYGKHQSMLYDGYMASKQSSDAKMRKMAQESSAAMARKIAEALVDPTQKSFVIGVIGSSVAAGHDNCFYDCYEKQMERTWSSVWEAAGMKLEVRNAGQGGGCGDTYKNQIWCLKQTAGQDIDVAHYTWTYFESRDRYPYHEVFARNALLLPKHPVPQIWNTGPGSCYGDSPLPKAYAKFGFTYLCLEKGLKSGGIYPGKKWGVVGDGYHNTTRYGEKLDDEERRNSLGVVFRNWHPGPLGFQYISDAFVYRYAEATLDALDMIEEALESDSDPVETFARPIYTASDLPKPQNCIEKFCPMDEPSECLNLEEPTFGFHGASPASASDDLNLYAKAKQNWATFRNDRGPNYMVSKSDIKYMKRDPSLQCTFPDHCAGFQGSWDSGTLAFRLPKMSMGVISVCFCCGKKSGIDFLEQYKDWVDFELDGEHKLDKSKFFAGKGFGEKCVTVMDEWPNGLSNNNGHFYLGVIVRDDLIPEVNRTKFNLRLDHVVTM